MTVVILTDCPPRLRGDLTKWLLEINTGVYVGRVSARVRDQLWERICANVKTGRATMVFRASNEQRMDFRVHNTTWQPVDFDGVKLMRRPLPSTAAKAAVPYLPDGFSRAAQQQKARRMAAAARGKPRAGTWCWMWKRPASMRKRMRSLKWPLCALRTPGPWRSFSAT